MFTVKHFNLVLVNNNIKKHTSCFAVLTKLEYLQNTKNPKPKVPLPAFSGAFNHMLLCLSAHVCSVENKKYRLKV